MGNDFTITREYAKYLALDLHYISNKLSIEEVTDPAGNYIFSWPLDK